MSNRDKEPVTELLKLRAPLSKLAQSSDDQFVREVERVIKNFSYFPALGQEYNWAYLEDGEFDKQVALAKTPKHINLLFLSHIVRVIEAFELVSIWRMADLATGSIRNLNNNELISACTLSRAMIELVARYGDAANFLFRYFENLAWDKYETDVIVLQIQKDPSNSKNVEPLETYVERLVHATRLKESIQNSKHMQATNIQTIIERLDKR